MGKIVDGRAFARRSNSGLAYHMASARAGGTSPAMTATGYERHCRWLGQDSAPRRAFRARSCQRAVPLLALGLDPREGMARRKAQTYGGPHLLLGDAAGAFRRATCALFGALPRFALLERIAKCPRLVSACSFRGDLANTGPRFRLGCRVLSATPRSSASSWQGLVVVPGGAPVPPECPCRVHELAGRRTPSRRS